MKVVLTYPEYPNTFWSYRYALPFIGKKAVFPPLGLLTVAAMLPGDWSLRLVDLNVEPLRDEDVADADFVFISAMTVQRRSAEEVIARCRRLGVKTVAGGPLFTTCHDDFPEVTHLVLGEAEVTLPAFLADLHAGKANRLYPSHGFPDLASTPLPRWDLIDMRMYASMNIQYSRGCPFDCEFCDITQLFGRKPRTKTQEQVLAELDALHAAGWRGSVFFVDDNFIGDVRRLKNELLPELVSWMEMHGNPFYFYTEASINLADDDELMEAMVRAGFREVFIGVETPDEESLKETGKVQNRNRDLVGSVRRILRAGLQVHGGFIVGFDSDTPAVFERQLSFVQERGIVTAMVGLLTALRGTKLYERLQREGRLIATSSGDNTSDSLNFVPRMDPDVLVTGYRNLVKRLYAPEQYYERLTTFLAEYRPREMRQRFFLRKRDLRALFRSILVLGVLGRERLHYWRIFFWSLRHRPRLFPLAITLAVHGFHFRKVAEELGCPGEEAAST